MTDSSGLVENLHLIMAMVVTRLTPSCTSVYQGMGHLLDEIDQVEPNQHKYFGQRKTFETRGQLTFLKICT